MTHGVIHSTNYFWNIVSFRNEMPLLCIAQRHTTQLWLYFCFRSKNRLLSGNIAYEMHIKSLVNFQNTYSWKCTFEENSRMFLHIVDFKGDQRVEGPNCSFTEASRGSTSEPILPICRIRKLRWAAETPGAPLLSKIWIWIIIHCNAVLSLPFYCKNLSNYVT